MEADHDRRRRDLMRVTAAGLGTFIGGALASDGAQRQSPAEPSSVLPAGGRPSPTGSVGGHEAKFANVNGARTRYYDVGAGEPLLLIHGSRPAGRSSANTWTPILSSLGRRYRVIAPDRLGHGMTENPRGEYLPAFEMEHLHQFLKTLGIKQFHVIGQSTGAYHAARLGMELTTGSIKSITIVDSATLSPPVGNLGERRNTLFSGRPKDPKEAFRFDMQQLSHSRDHVTEEFVNAAFFMANQPGGQRTDAAMRGPAAQAYEDAIRSGAQEIREWIAGGKYQIPTLLYWGKDDPSAILATGLALFDLVSQRNARTRMLIANRAGHFHYREHPEEFSRNVITFSSAA